MGTQTKNIPKTELRKDEFAYSAFTAMKAYKPAQQQYSQKNVTALYNAMRLTQMEEVRKKGEYQAAHDNAVAATHAFHDAMIRVKTQVRAQFGEDSNELQALGLKKKSERKAPVRSKPQKREEGAEKMDNG